MPPTDGALGAQEPTGTPPAGDRTAGAPARHQHQLQQRQTFARLRPQVARAHRSVALGGADQTDRSAADGYRQRNGAQSAHLLPAAADAVAG